MSLIDLLFGKNLTYDVVFGCAVEVFFLGYHQGARTYVLVRPDDIALWEGPD